MMVELDSMPVMRIISQATRVIAEGEVLQLSKVRDASTTEEIYMEVIRGKTAMLFEASTHSAATLAGASEEQREALRPFRSEERGVGKEWVSTCRSRWWRDH